MVEYTRLKLCHTDHMCPVQYTHNINSYKFPFGDDLYMIWGRIQMNIVHLDATFALLSQGTHYMIY